MNGFLIDTNVISEFTKPEPNRRVRFWFETADALIAATALEYNLTLVTRNVKDFDSVGTLIFNPWQ